ncbi:MAG: esterase/lipase family protein [Sinimarinibacterium flocculans]|uniref:esterase/lipase family protein n=1 Tax=Sinimarinibacterium flocculans TaxID=985250 RepID=UPI003C4748CF
MAAHVLSAAIRAMGPPAFAFVLGTLLAPGAGAAAPPLTVAAADLDAGFACTQPLQPQARAVLLVHGTSVTPEENWGWSYERAMPAQGLSTCTVRLPDYAFVDIQLSSEYVVHAIRRMYAATGRAIGVVGISQGGLQPRWAIRWWPDVAAAVDDLVMLATPNHGGPLANLSCTAPCLPALWQQAEGSAFLHALNAGDETPGDIAYSSIYSLTDWVIQPAAPVPTAALDGAANIAIQDVCPGRVVDHVQHAFDAVVWALTVDALMHPGPADPARLDPGVCLLDTMPLVDPVDARRRMAEVYALAAQRQSAYERKVDHEPGLRAYVADGGLVPGAGAGAAGLFLLFTLTAPALLRAFWRSFP